MLEGFIPLENFLFAYRRLYSEFGDVVSRKLPNEFGFERKVSLREEINRMLELLTREKIPERIEKMKHAIISETQWSGEKERPDVIEVYNPGEKDRGIHEPKLDTGRRGGSRGNP